MGVGTVDGFVGSGSPANSTGLNTSWSGVGGTPIRGVHVQNPIDRHVSSTIANQMRAEHSNEEKTAPVSIVFDCLSGVCFFRNIVRQAASVEHRRCLCQLFQFLVEKVLRDCRSLRVVAIWRCSLLYRSEIANARQWTFFFRRSDATYFLSGGVRRWRIPAPGSPGKFSLVGRPGEVAVELDR